MKKKDYLDGETYRQSLQSKDPEQRFYERLRTQNKTYRQSWFTRLANKLRAMRKKRELNRTIRRLERKGWTVIDGRNRKL